MFQITKRKCRIVDPFYCFILFCIAAFSLYLLSCNSRVEGCLDINAENFDLNADKSCKDCCRYPSMSLILTQRWNERNFQLTDTLYDRNNKPFFITDLKYILSEFVWEDMDGVEYSIDSTTINCGSQMITYTSDLLQIDARKFSYPLDSIKIFPMIENLTFDVGWPADLACVDAFSDDVPVVFQQTNPLWDPGEEKRAAIRFVIQPDVSVDNLDTIYIHNLKEISIPYDHDLPVGLDAVLEITVNYAQWFLHADINDTATIASSVIDNLENSFTRTP